MRYNSIEELNIEYKKRILQIADDYQVEIPSSKPEISDLIRALYKKYSEQVVVLIDEYDKPMHKPMQDAIAKGDKTLFSETKSILHGIYTPLKSCDPYLKFLFLTGISKYAGVSIFSTLNNLNDISLDECYSTICGYTQEELENNFKDNIDMLAQALSQKRGRILENVKTWYNGYSWDGKTTVYNPFSTLCLFEKRKFKNFWFQTGTPSYLIRLLRGKSQLKAVLGKTVTYKLEATTDNPDEIGETILFFQTGYLTIKEISTNLEGEERYTLDFPNAEVRVSFIESLLAEYGKYPEDQPGFLRERLKTELLAGESSALTETLRVAFAWIPYEIIVENEHYYHSLMLLWLRLLGFNITAEISTNFGRIDAVWELPEQTIVAEIKYAKPSEEDSAVVLDKLLAEGFAQIEAKRYSERYKAADKKLTALAIACFGKEIKCEIRD
jgi:hypothetical protein